MSSGSRKDSLSRMRMIQAARKPSQAARASLMKRISTATGTAGRSSLQQRLSVAHRTSRAVSIKLPRRESQVAKERGDSQGAEPGGVGALIKAIHCFPNNEGLVRECCGLLAEYFPTATSEWEAVRGEALDALSGAMTRFSSTADIILAIVNALNHLSTLEEQKPEDMCRLLVKKDIVRKCLTAIKLSTSEAMNASCLKLTSFAALYDEVAKEISDAGGLDAALASMSTYPDNIEIQCTACLVVGNLCVVDEVADIAGKKGASEKILESISRHNTDTDLLDSACRAMGSLAMNDDLCTKLVNAGGIKLVLKLMKTHPEEEKIQECGCWALACFSGHDEAVSCVLEEGGLQQVIQTMESEYLSPTVQEYGCRIIVNLSMNGGEEGIISKKDVLDVLLKAMESYDNNEVVNEHATFALSKILPANESLQAEFVEASGIGLTIDAMKQFPHNDGLQENGVLVLANVAMETDARRRILETDGLETILATMNLACCRDNLILQCVGCNTISNLIAEEASHKEQIVQDGGLTTMVFAMRHFENNDELQECAIRVFAYLSSIESLHSDLADSGCVSLILTAMEQHSENIDLLEAAVQALQMLSPSSDGAACSEDVHRAIKQIVASIKMHTEDENIFSVACQVLSSYALSPYSHHWMSEDGFLELAVERLSKFSAAVDIQGYGCQLLGLLCFTNDLCSKLLDAGILERLAHAMETCSMDTQLQITCCGALACLVSECAEQTFSLLTASNMPLLLLMAVGNHSDNIDVLLAGLIAIKYLTGNAQALKQLVEGSGHDIIQKSCSFHKHQEELQTEAAEVLRMIK